MYKENKRRRRDKPHTALDNINDDNEERSGPEIGHDLPSFNDFLVSDDIMGNGNDFHYCSMCLKMGNLMRPLSTSERMTLLSDHRIYVSPNARRCVTACCETPCERPQEPTRLSSHQVRRLISDLILQLSRAKHTPLLAEDDPTFSDDDYIAWTGWSIDQLKSMTVLITPRMRNSKYRSPMEAVCLFWVKLKTNLSFRQIGTLFKIDTQEESIRRRVEDTFHAVLGYLNESLVPKYLGLTHISRTEALNHHTAYSRAFFGDQLSIIWDGTYIYCNKSNDHALQRSSYSGQKSRHLIKMMSLVLPDGYVLDLIGPFYGKDNDASISKVIVSHCQKFLTESIFLISKEERSIKCGDMNRLS
jgi:hypothetical protein